MTKLWVGALLALVSVSSAAALPPAVDGEPLPSLAPMLERVKDAVVNISTESEVRVRRAADPFFDDPFFRRFFGSRGYIEKRKRQGLGSGVVFDAQAGLILTNAHVIEGADKITVALQSGVEGVAKVIGKDKDSDLAVIQVDLEGLQSVPLGNSDQLRVGDFVVAIGNPFGLRQTVTSGIVSALGRSGLGIENYVDFIQTDASINPGNSGGALVNLRGELVGINTAIVAPSGGNVGIGFAIPINMAVQIKKQLLEYGAVQRGRLGVRIQELTPRLAEAFGVDEPQGVIVTRVSKDSTAEMAGLQPGDVILAINERRVTSGADLKNAIGLQTVGEALTIQLIRDGERILVETQIQRREFDASVGGSLNENLEGAFFGELSEQNLTTTTDGGIYVTRVERNSPAWNAGLRPGDVIVSANRKAVRDLTTFRLAVADQDVLRLYLVRGNSALFLLIQ